MRFFHINDKFSIIKSLFELIFNLKKISFSILNISLFKLNLNQGMDLIIFKNRNFLSKKYGNNNQR